MEGDLSLIAMGRLAKRATGARIAAPAKEALRDATVEYIEVLAKDAWAIARNAKRQTVKRQDIAVALKMRRQV